MKRLGIAVAIGLLAACAIGAALEDDQAAVAALVPGSIIRASWGWIITNPGGETHVIRKDSGYTVTTPRETFHLIRTAGGGFTVSPGRKGVRELSPDQAIEVRERLKGRR